jgi:hypothetical protein
LAASFTAAVDGYAMTSVLNTNEKKEMHEPVVELEEIELEMYVGNYHLESPERDRDIPAQLRIDLNAQESH